jgi:hypothetical protein
MFKLKFYLENAFLSSLIGMAAFFVYLLIWLLSNSFFDSLHKLITSFSKHPLLLFYNILYYMAIGAVIGTVSFGCFFQIFLRFGQRPWVGYLSNFLVVAVMNMAGAVYYGMGTYKLFIRSPWLVALIVSEVLSFFLTALWRRRIKAYKQKLEEKKALLKSQADL